MKSTITKLPSPLKLAPAALGILGAIALVGSSGQAYAANHTESQQDIGPRQFRILGNWYDVDPANALHALLDPGIQPFYVSTVYSTFPEWFTYTICDDQYADAILQAIDVLGDIGVPYSGVFADAGDCAANAGNGGATIDVTFPVTGVNGKRTARGSNHTILAVPGTGGWRHTGLVRSGRYRYPNLSDAQISDKFASTGGVAFALGLARNAGGIVTQADYGWKIYLPSYSITQLTFPPAETLIYGGATGLPSVFVPEVTLHELVHTLGFPHVSVNENNHSMESAFGESLSTIMPAGTCGADFENYGFLGATWKDQTLYHPTLAEATSELFLPSMEHAAIANAYTSLNITDGEPILVPWHPDVEVVLLSPTCAVHSPLPTDLNGLDTVPLRGCPSGYMPKGYSEPGEAIGPGEYIVEDAEDLGRIMPLVSHYTSGTTLDADELALFALDASGAAVAKSWPGTLTYANTGALGANQLAGLKIDPIFRVNFPEPLINMSFYADLEPPCSGCDRSADAYPLAVGFADEPNSSVRIAATLERPRECGYRWVGGGFGAPLVEVLDEATFPCCAESPPPQEG